VFSCPFEAPSCGSRNDIVLSTDGYTSSIQSSPVFKRNKACYYTISGPLGASSGDLLYLKIISNVNVKTVVTMANDMNDQTPKTICNVSGGSVVVARHP
jgi:hypothetical protein